MKTGDRVRGKSLDAKNEEWYRSTGYEPPEDWRDPDYSWHTGTLLMMTTTVYGRHTIYQLLEDQTYLDYDTIEVLEEYEAPPGHREETENERFLRLVREQEDREEEELSKQELSAWIDKHQAGHHNQKTHGNWATGKQSLQNLDKLSQDQMTTVLDDLSAMYDYLSFPSASDTQDYSDMFEDVWAVLEHVQEFHDKRFGAGDVGLPKAPPSQAEFESLMRKYGFEIPKATTSPEPRTSYVGRPPKNPISQYTAGPGSVPKALGPEPQSPRALHRAGNDRATSAQFAEMSPAHQEAWRTYTSPDGEEVNRILRGITNPDDADPRLAKAARDLRAAFKSPATRKTTEDEIAYRGITGNYYNGRAGEVKQCKGVFSTSTVERTAGGFGTVGKPPIKVTIPKGTTYLLGYPGEQEIMLAPGTKFRLDAVDRDGYPTAVTIVPSRTKVTAPIKVPPPRRARTTTQWAHPAAKTPAKIAAAKAASKASKAVQAKAVAKAKTAKEKAVKTAKAKAVKAKAAKKAGSKTGLQLDLEQFYMGVYGATAAEARVMAEHTLKTQSPEAIMMWLTQEGW